MINNKQTLSDFHNSEKKSIGNTGSFPRITEQDSELEISKISYKDTNCRRQQQQEIFLNPFQIDIQPSQQEQEQFEKRITFGEDPLDIQPRYSKQKEFRFKKLTQYNINDENNVEQQGNKSQIYNQLFTIVSQQMRQANSQLNEHRLSQRNHNQVFQQIDIEQKQNMVNNYQFEQQQNSKKKVRHSRTYTQPNIPLNFQQQQIQQEPNTKNVKQFHQEVSEVKNKVFQLLLEYQKDFQGKKKNRRSIKQQISKDAINLQSSYYNLMEKYQNHLEQPSFISDISKSDISMISTNTCNRSICKGNTKVEQEINQMIHLVEEFLNKFNLDQIKKEKEFFESVPGQEQKKLIQDMTGDQKNIQQTQNTNTKFLAKLDSEKGLKYINTQDPKTPKIDCFDQILKQQQKQQQNRQINHDYEGQKKQQQNQDRNQELTTQEIKQSFGAPIVEIKQSFGPPQKQSSIIQEHCIGDNTAQSYSPEKDITNFCDKPQRDSIVIQNRENFLQSTKLLNGTKLLSYQPKYNQGFLQVFQGIVNQLEKNELSEVFEIILLQIDQKFQKLKNQQNCQKLNIFLKQQINSFAKNDQIEKCFNQIEKINEILNDFCDNFKDFSQYENFVWAQLKQILKTQLDEIPEIQEQNTIANQKQYKFDTKPPLQAYNGQNQYITARNYNDNQLSQRNSYGSQQNQNSADNCDFYQQRGVKSCFYELAAQIKSNLPENHVGQQILISEIFQIAKQEQIEKQNWNQFIQQQFMQ